MLRPARISEIALARSEVVAVGINALTGVTIVTAMALLLLVPLFTLTVGVLFGVLMGPLAAFIVSSLYVRIEHNVGWRLGGAASRNDLYRVVAWSFLPLGIIALLYAVVHQLLTGLSGAVNLVVALPFALLLLAVLCGYVVSLARMQRFSKLKGSASVLVSMVLTLVVLGGAASGVWLLNYYGRLFPGWSCF